MKDVRNYAEKVAEIIGEQAKVKSVFKNGAEFIGVLVKGESNMCPTIYVEQFIADGLAPEQAAVKVLEIAERNKAPEFDTSLIYDLEKAKDSIYAVIEGTALNKQKLEGVPHTFVEGSEQTLVYTYKVYISAEVSCGVTNDIMDMWGGMNTRELHEIALENTRRLYPAHIQSMNGIIKEMIGEDIKDENEMYVVSNRSARRGAAAFLYPESIEKIKEIFGNRKVFVIPSSLHEVILVPCDDVQDELEQIKGIAEIVIDVNKTQVDITDKLADAVYMLENGQLSLKYTVCE